MLGLSNRPSLPSRTRRWAMSRTHGGTDDLPVSRASSRLVFAERPVEKALLQAKGLLVALAPLWWTSAVKRWGTLDWMADL